MKNIITEAERIPTQGLEEKGRKSEVIETATEARHC
jgi:hypothetical protein